MITAGAGTEAGETRLIWCTGTSVFYQKIIPDYKTKLSGNFACGVQSSGYPDVCNGEIIRISRESGDRIRNSSGYRPVKVSGWRTSIVDSKSVHAFIIGEHGDSEIVRWSSANIRRPVRRFLGEMRGNGTTDKIQENIAETVKRSAYEIIERKQATYYGAATTIEADLRR